MVKEPDLEDGLRNRAEGRTEEWMIVLMKRSFVVKKSLDNPQKYSLALPRRAQWRKHQKDASDAYTPLHSL